jgi:hypothetical protein
MNLGFQRELHPGTVLSVDFVRNVTTQLLLGVDLNHTGDTRYFYKNNATAAIAATNASKGCGNSASASSINCAIAAGATITDYAGAGLDAQGDLGGSRGCPPGGCAFGGLNPTAPAMTFLVPAGRSAYTALDFKITQQVHNPTKGIKNLNFTFSYSLSTFKNSGGASATTPGAVSNSDQDFVIAALDNANPNRYFGPSLLDRTHQLSFGFVADLPGSFRASVISHFYSPLADQMIVPGTGTASIFQTDFNGDGTSQDPLPGTKNGSFGREVSPGTINTLIGAYNNNYAGNLTPAGKVLVQNGLFTQAQLVALGAVAPTVTPAPTGQVGLDWLRAFDLKLSWIYKRVIGDHTVEIEPSVGAFNLMNLANFDLPPNVMTGVLNGAAGSINGTTYADRVSNRVGAGTGVFALGAPRTFEFGLRIGF